MERFKGLIAILSLIRRGLNARDANNNTPLILAINYRYSEIAQALVEMGANLDIRDEEGRTALNLAELSGQDEIKKSILKAREVNTNKFENAVPLCSRGRNQCQNDASAIRLAANNEAKTVTGMDLIRAIAAGKIETAVDLINKGVNLNEQDSCGYTALMWAIANGLRDLTKMLIDRGADLDKKDVKGRNALDWAIAFERIGILELVKSAKTTS